MKSKAAFAVVCLFGTGLALSRGVGAQQPATGAQGGAAPAGRGAAAAGGGGGQPAPAREYTVAGIPGVVAAGAKWELIWGGNDNADGIVGQPDGLLYAKEQRNRVDKIDMSGKVTPFIEGTHGTGSIAIAADGRVLGAARTCTDPGGKPDECKEPTAIVQLKPAYKVLADNFNGMPLGRVNDLVVAKNGGVYFNGNGTFYMSPTGKVSAVGDNVRSNGILLSRDEKTLYVTSGGGLLAFDVQADGSVTNQREFVKWEGGGGDGMTVDSEGRLYVTTGQGVQVSSADGKYLGLIATPRGCISVAFGGPDKKTMFIVGSGAVDAAGKDLRTPEGVRNNAKSLYKIQMISQGFAGRAK